MFSRRMVLAGAAALPLTSLRAAPAPEAVALFAGEQRFSGIVAMGRRGRVTDLQAFGLADRARGLPFAPTSTFRIGSVTKWLTSIAVLRLVERGQLALQVGIGHVLPELGPDFASVPLSNLLANNSGIPDLVAAAVKSDSSLRASTAGSAEIVRRFASGTAIFPPGARFDYSFFNWVLVHAMIERVTGKPFTTVIAEEVFRPARMRQAGFIDTAHPFAAGAALAYDAAGALKLALVPPFGGASGNVHASAADLVALAHHVYSGGLLSPASLRELNRVRVPEEDYALGGRMRTVLGRTLAWQTGKVGAYRAHLAHDLAADRTVVILGNSDTDQPAMGKLAETLLVPPLA